MMSCNSNGLTNGMMACNTNDLTDEELQIDRIVQSNYEPCHNCRNGIMDIVEVTTKLSFLELPVWKLKTNQHALHCQRCKFTIPYIEIQKEHELLLQSNNNETKEVEDDEQSGILLQPSPSDGDHPPVAVHKSSSNAGPTMILDVDDEKMKTISIKRDIINWKRDATEEAAVEAVVVEEERNAKGSIGGDGSGSSYKDSIQTTTAAATTAASNNDKNAVIHVVEDGPIHVIEDAPINVVDVVDTPPIINVVDDAKEDDLFMASMMGTTAAPLFNYCYQNLIVITDEDERIISQQHQQQEQQEQEQLRRQFDEQKGNQIPKEVIVLEDDDINERAGKKNDGTEKKGVKVIPIVEEEAQSIFSWASSKNFTTPSIDASLYGLSSWKVFSI